MALINRFQSSISSKLLWAFLVITSFSLITSFISLNTHTQTHKIQAHLAHKALPLVTLSQHLSHSVFKYISELEKISISPSTHLHGDIQIEQREETLKSDLQKLQGLIDHPDTLTPITALIDDIVLSTQDIKPWARKTSNQQIQTIDKPINDIRHWLENIQTYIRQYQINTAIYSPKNSTVRRLDNINRELINVDRLLSRYNEKLSPQALSDLKSSYRSSIKKVKQQLTLIQPISLKNDIENYSTHLSSHITDEKGFFATAALHNQKISLIANLIQQNKSKESEINRLLEQLVETTNQSFKTELIGFSTTMEHNHSIILLIIVFMIITSTAVVFFFIVPKLTNRLNQLTKDTQQLSSGEYQINISTKGSDEISLIAKALETLRCKLITIYNMDERVKDKEARLRNIFDNAVDGLITINQRGIIESFNPASEQIFGYSAHEVIGKNVNILMSSLHHHQHDGYLKHYLTTGEKKIIGIGREVEGKRKDGSVFPLDLSISEINIDGERIFSGIIRDISTRKQTENEREKLINELVDSNEELTRFAYVCSHDLQEPLRMVRSFSEKLQHHFKEPLQDDEKGTKYLEFVSQGATTAQTLISDVLTYSSIDNESDPLQQIDCMELVQSIIENKYINLEDRQGKITFDDLPVVPGNKTQLLQLFQNLINNGIKYQQPNQQAHVHISIEDKDPFWLFSVKDNGIGMDSRYLKKIFDVFQRLHRRSQYAGSGIGLSICKKVVERHGGQIWVTSEKNVGSIFYFTLLKMTNKDENK